MMGRIARMALADVAAWWRGSCRPSWVVWSASVVLAMVAVALGSWMLLDAMAGRRVIVDELETLRAVRGSKEAQVTPAADVSASDFAQRLPEKPQAEAMAAELQRTCAAAGVLIGSMQFQHLAPSADQLARSEIVLSLKGTYPKLKQAIGEALARFPNATLRRMSLRELPPAAEAEASVVIVLWGRPIPSETGPAGGSR